MKLLVAIFFALAVSASAEIIAAGYWDGMQMVELKVAETAPENWEIDWSKVVPVTEIPGFWDGRDLKQFFTNDNLNRGARIVGGEIVVPHTHPYQAGLLMQFAGGTGLCGGSMVSTRTVLTAAHCPENSITTQVILGAHQLTANEPNQHRQTVPESGYRIHELYLRQTLHNDVALLLLPADAPINQFIVPTVLPTAHATETFAGELATISGERKIELN